MAGRNEFISHDKTMCHTGTHIIKVGEVYQIPYGPTVTVEGFRQSGLDVVVLTNSGECSTTDFNPSTLEKGLNEEEEE